MKGLWGVHFEPKGVHLLIIPRKRKKLEQLRSDLDFRAVLEHKCDLSILVNDSLFNHHRPNGVIPVIISYAPELSFAVVILSSPDMVSGETYTITVGATSVEFEAY